jgi:SAM-dependent methyltransferase
MSRLIRSKVVLNVSRFSAKANQYEPYRWPFSPEAIESLLNIGGLDLAATVADVGSGTGMLSRTLLQAGLNVIAVEPNDEMRAVAERNLAAHAGFTSVAAYSDATSLPNHSVDLITVGRALHWLPAASTREEFLRIVKPGGSLAILATSYGDCELRDATRAIQLEANGWDVAHGKRNQPQMPFEFYFGGTHFQSLSFPMTVTEDWPRFFGRLCSYSSAPDSGDPLFSRYEKSAEELFNRFAIDGQIVISTSTDMYVGTII